MDKEFLKLQGKNEILKCERDVIISVLIFRKRHQIMMAQLSSQVFVNVNLKWCRINLRENRSFI